MKVVKTIAILVGGPLVGLLVALVLAALALPPDPNFISNGGHASPGDGILIIGYILISFLISIPLSILLAAIVLFRAKRKSNPAH
jgi:hypothetical protein